MLALRPFIEATAANLVGWLLVAHFALGWKFFRSLREYSAQAGAEGFSLSYCLVVWCVWPWYVGALIYKGKHGRWPAWSPREMREPRD